MIERYSTKKLSEIWSEESKFNAWLLVELFSVEAYAKINPKITEAEIKALWKNSKIDTKRINEIEKETRHDVVAFTRQISEGLGNEKKWVHYGLTSTDVVDTAQSYRLKLANTEIRLNLTRLLNVIKDLAKKYKKTYCIGRTHGIHAEVTTFGYKLAVWFDEMNRNLERFDKAAKQIEIAKISGAVGNYANTPLEIQEYVANKLGLGSSKISTQTLQRDRHAEYIFALGVIGSSLDKFATEIRHLQRTEVQELMEGFGTNQKGSSAMPHKKNPIASENICGLSRVLRGYLVTAMENIALWHERDISHSSAERIILPDATQLVDYMLTKFASILENLKINEKMMLENIGKTNNMIFSQRVLSKLIDEKNMSREEAYDKIQKIAFEAFEKNRNFLELITEAKILDSKEVAEIQDLSYYSKNVEAIFERLKI